MGAEPQSTRSPDAAGAVRTLGEFGLIAQVTSRLTSGPGVLVGPGDDAAVVRAADGRVVVSTDVLVETVHFRRDWSSAYEVGAKAAAQNCADIAAMGARPTALVVGLAAPADLPVAWAEGLADGLRDEGGRAGAHVVGGDMARSSAVVVSVTALGDLEGRAPLLRGGAGEGDLVVVAGRLGASAAGLALHLSGRADLLERFAALARLHRVPQPDYAAGPALADAGASALLDTSDGLLQDLGHVARASGVLLELDADALGADVAGLEECAAALGADPWEWVLGGGEDHALAGTSPRRRGLPEGVRVVGRVRSAGAGGGRVALLGREMPTSAGWDHYGPG